ncbi:MAG: tyrosine phosphatase family protein [Ancalomicrobiaceae bacterium]|nr:tyrosine phosphatase family protein [Ancalomicrobiaceae bacterium]
MPSIHVCSLARMPDTVAEIGASHIATLISSGTPVPTPLSIAPDDHLTLAFNDIIEPMEGMVPPGEDHVEALIDFVRRWDLMRPMVIHCYAGVSRSTAGAFIALCALDPAANEADLALELRRRSPSATPNARMIRIADRILGRGGRMVAAIEAIGRGEDAFEGVPFSIAAGRRTGVARASTGG